MLTKQDLIQKIKDDLYLTGKQAIMDNLPENQNALFIGKFRIPTGAHIKIIEEALKRFNSVVVCIVKATKEEKESLPLDMQQKIFELIFGNKVTVISYSSGNITSIINKSPKRIRYLLSGTDRVEGYKAQLVKHPSISIVETPRDMDNITNISATDTINAIKNDDILTFKRLTDSKIWDMFDEFKKVFK